MVLFKKDEFSLKNELVGSSHVKGAVGGGSWHRGDNVNFYPDSWRFRNQAELRTFISEQLLEGTLPIRPLFSKESKLLTLGSCFARELQEVMREYSHDLDHLWMPEGLNNTFALRQFIEWVLTNNSPTDGYWYDAHERGGAVRWTPTKEKEDYRGHFIAADGFVFTIGLAEIWRDRETNGVFWRGVPEDVFDEKKHIFEVSSVKENASNIQQIISLIQEHCPEKPIIITLSPVPLSATFREISCIVADCASKSILRTAIDEVFRSKPLNTFYWPAFEIVKWCGPHLPYPTYGVTYPSKNITTCRQVSRQTVDLIIGTFLTHYFSGVSLDKSANSDGFWAKAKGLIRRIFG